MNSLIISVDSLNHSADRRNYAVDSRINSVDLRIYADINENICECVIKRLNGGEFLFYSFIVFTFFLNAKTMGVFIRLLLFFLQHCYCSHDMKVYK